MGLGGKQKQQTTTQTQVSEPWAAQQPYLKDLFQRAQSFADSGGPRYFEGQLVADRSQDTSEAQKLTRQTAQNVQPFLQNLTSSAMFNLGGGRDVANNPYLQSAIQAAMNPVIQNFQTAGGPLSQIRSAFTANNSGGSGTREGIAAGIAARGLNQQLADMSSTMTMQAYQQAQQQALQTLGMAPQLLQMQNYPAQLLAGVGQSNDAYAQALIDAEVQRHMFNAQQPAEALKLYGSLVGGNFGGTTTGTSTQPGVRSNPLMSGLGGALSGASLGSMLGLGTAAMPWAAGIGGLVGLLG